MSGSICAGFALKGVFHLFMSGGVTVPSVSVGQAFAFEFIITFNLVFDVTTVATDTRGVRSSSFSFYLFPMFSFFLSLEWQWNWWWLAGWRIGWHCRWSYCFAQHPHMRVRKLVFIFSFANFLLKFRQKKHQFPNE